MTAHDRFAAHELIHRWWVNYDEGNLGVLGDLLADDCHLSSRTDRGQHPQEDFIRSDNRGREDVMAWTAEHRARSPYPLRHHATNVHVTAERDEEIDLESYVFVNQIVERRPVPLSSGMVHWTLLSTPDGYRVLRQHVVLDAIESAPFDDVADVASRQAVR